LAHIKFKAHISVIVPAVGEGIHIRAASGGPMALARNQNLPMGRITYFPGLEWTLVEGIFRNFRRKFSTSSPLQNQSPSALTT